MEQHVIVFATILLALGLVQWQLVAPGSLSFSGSFFASQSQSSDSSSSSSSSPSPEASSSSQHSSSFSSELDEVRRKTDQILSTLGRLEARLSKLESAQGSSNTNSNSNAQQLASSDVAPSTPSPQKLGESTIHFMYGLWDDDETLPRIFQDTMDAWRAQNPSWSIKLWNAKEIKELWRESYPEFKHLWKKTKPIQRADIARLMILIKFGGLYADLDCVPSKPIDQVLDEAGFRHVAHHTVVCTEDEKTPEMMAHTANWRIRKGVPEFHIRIANYVMWAKPQSPTLKRALMLAKKRVESLSEADYGVTGRPDLNNPYAIIYSTGPDVLTEAVFESNASGKRNLHPEGTVVVPEGKCHMTNKATGTWIGDHHPAWGQAKQA